jgi:protein SCO1/2
MDSHATRRSWFAELVLPLVCLALMMVMVSLWVREQRRLNAPIGVFGQVPRFTLVDQDGRRVSDGDFARTPWVADFIFTNCEETCPVLTQEMQRLQVRLRARGLGSAARLASFTVDPANDTPPRLKAYARRFDADLASWSFLSGTSDEMQAVVERGFKQVDARSADEGFGIIHGTHLVLVDGAGRIRGYYGLGNVERDRLVGDIERLVRGVVP